MTARSKTSTNPASAAEVEFTRRLREATRSRRRWVNASEVAGDLCYAAKALKKVEDPERRFDLLCGFLFSGGEMLKSVDDSNASLQSVFWDGDVASELWDATAPLVADKGKIVRLLLKLHDEGWDRIVFNSVLDWNRLYLPEEHLKTLRDAVFAQIEKNLSDPDSRFDLDVPAKIWAQCGDVDKFDGYVRDTLRLPADAVWSSRIEVLSSCKRWADAEAAIRKYAPEHAVRAYILDLARKRGDPAALSAAYKEWFDSGIDIRTLREARKELPESEFREVVQHVADCGGKGPFLDPDYATALLENGMRDRLREYVLAHRNDDICGMRLITGYFPLGTALGKADEPLLATIPVRLGVLYLMSQGNSKFYPTVQRKMSDLETLAARVPDWGTVQPHSDFERDFREAFSSRRSYWS